MSESTKHQQWDGYPARDAVEDCGTGLPSQTSAGRSASAPNAATHRASFQVALVNGKTYQVRGCDERGRIETEALVCSDCMQGAVRWSYWSYPGGFEFMSCGECGSEFPLLDEKYIERCVRCGWAFAQGEVEYGDGPVLCATGLNQPRLTGVE
jgi:hypothetical protein